MKKITIERLNELKTKADLLEAQAQLAISQANAAKAKYNVIALAAEKQGLLLPEDQEAAG